MFLVTNREPRGESGGPEILLNQANHKGPNELRLVEAVRRDRKWKLTVLKDKVTAGMRDEAGAKSLHVVDYAANKILQRVNPQAHSPRSRRKGRNLLVFVHGFNSDVEDVLDRSAGFASNFGVEVLPFIWPSEGGGNLTDPTSYKWDKRSAKASTGALDRVLYEVRNRVKLLTAEWRETARKEAERRVEDNDEKRTLLLSRLLEKECPFTVNLLTHSMGTYLYKHLLLSSASEGRGLVFDNVVLAAADANNDDHARWVDEIRARRRVYITINEDDRALQLSRAKAGEEQQARLGHYPFNLYSRHAAYVQFTNAAHVGGSHSYFEGGPLENAKVKKFFRTVLNGKRGESRLDFDAASNTYRL